MKVSTFRIEWPILNYDYHKTSLDFLKLVLLKLLEDKTSQIFVLKFN